MSRGNPDGDLGIELRRQTWFADFGLGAQIAVGFLLIGFLTTGLWWQYGDHIQEFFSGEEY